ncbi:MAG TPA: HAMP domain-containing protein, partial [bacterium]|nr:HAMP domain-containing protein [bacterium]
MKLHFKLFITFGLITAIALTSIFIYLDRNLNRTYVSQLKDNIKKQTQATKTLLLSSKFEPHRVDSIVHNIGKDLALRITIIDKQGRVVGDSELKHNEAIKLENHLQRPEIIDAIKKGEGWSQRFSTTLKKDIIYYAIPFNSSSFNGFIRFAIPVERVSLVFDNTEGALLISILIVFIATLFVAIIAFNFISRPISNLANQAKRIADGDYSKKLIATSRDEVGELSNSL